MLGFDAVGHIAVAHPPNRSTVANLLTAAKGAYVYTGKAITVATMRAMGYVPYAVNGMTSVKQLARQTAKGAYAYAGFGITSAFVRNMIMGAYAYTGFVSRVGRQYITAGGAYFYNGIANVMTKTKLLTAAVGVYTYTGKAITSAFVRAMNKGSYVYTGMTASLIKTKLLMAAMGSYAYTGLALLIAKGARVVYDPIRQIDPALKQLRVNAAHLTSTRVAAPLLRSIRKAAARLKD